MNTQNLGIVSPVAMGDWQENFQYQKLNIVRHNGSSYIAKSENSGIEPGVESGWSAYWMLLNTDVEGAQGPQGPAGEGVPTGGLAGQVLSKNSDTNYDTKWIPQSQIAAGSAVNDGSGRNIVDTYETKADANTKNANLQDQITNNSQNIEKNSQIGARNSKRIDGLEQRINPSPFVTDSSVAYQKDIPENAVGAVEIQRIGGMTYKDGNTLKSAKVTEVKSVGVNLLTYPYNQSTRTINGVTFKDNGDGTITVNGTATATAIYVLHDYNLPVSGGVYTLSGLPSNGSEQSFIIQTANESGFFTNVYNTAGAKFTLGADTKLIVQLVVFSGYTAKNLVFEPMLNMGSTAQTYTPYVKRILPIPEAVRNIDGYGLGASDTVYNYIDWKKKQFVKRCASVDLGTLTWGYNSTASIGSCDISGIASTTSNLLLSNGAYDYSVMSGTASDPNMTFYVYNQTLFLKNTDYTSAAAYKAAMSGVMLVYELAEPIVTDISDLITSDNLLSIQGGGTLTFENEYGYDVPSTVEYITAEATA